MKRISQYVIGCTLLVTALSPASGDSTASEETGAGKTGPGKLSADVGSSATRSWDHSLDMLGIRGMECNCTFTIGEGERLWLFHAEPKIRGVDRDGPSHGRLKAGDVIVGIDGMLITTRKAGVRFANLVAGEPIELTVRRWGRTRSVTVVPRAAPDPEVTGAFTLRRYGRADTLAFTPEVGTFPELARSMEALSERAAELGEAVTTLTWPELPSLESFPDVNIDFGEMLPRGWIGFGLSFGGSIKQKDTGKPASWRFDDPPSIESIQPGSPADEAGLQVNDVLLEIDGLKLDGRKGGDRFSQMEPGQVIEWKVRRGGKTFTVETTAGERPPRRTVGATLAPIDPDAPLRYSGELGGTEIEVRGDQVHVDVDEETGEIVVRAGRAVVRLRAKGRR